MRQPGHRARRPPPAPPPHSLARGRGGLGGNRARMHPAHTRASRARPPRRPRIRSSLTFAAARASAAAGAAGMFVGEGEGTGMMVGIGSGVGSGHMITVRVPDKGLSISRVLGG